MTVPGNTYNLPSELASHFTKNVKYFENLLSKDFSIPNTLVTQDDLKKIERSYEASHRIREFEINLYWQRLNYLWAITAVLLAGWGILAIKIIESYDSNKSLGVLLSLSFLSIVGCTFTMIASFIVRAGKYWQKVWEYHICTLEPFVSGSLYSIPFKSKDKKFIKTSISRTVEVFNLCLLILWICSAILSAIISAGVSNLIAMWLQLVIAALILVIFFCIQKQVTKTTGMDIEVDISVSL